MVEDGRMQIRQSTDAVAAQMTNHVLSQAGLAVSFCMATRLACPGSLQIRALTGGCHMHLRAEASLFSVQICIPQRRDGQAAVDVLADVAFCIVFVADGIAFSATLS
jgi:hypothetical protein